MRSIKNGSIIYGVIFKNSVFLNAETNREMPPYIMQTTGRKYFLAFLKTQVKYVSDTYTQIAVFIRLDAK